MRKKNINLKQIRVAILSFIRGRAPATGYTVSPKLTMVELRLTAPRICPCSETGRDRTFPESGNLKLVFW